MVGDGAMHGLAQLFAGLGVMAGIQQLEKRNDEKHFAGLGANFESAIAGILAVGQEIGKHAPRRFHRLEIGGFDGRILKTDHVRGELAALAEIEEKTTHGNTLVERLHPSRGSFAPEGEAHAGGGKKKV